MPLDAGRPAGELELELEARVRQPITSTAGAGGGGMVTDMEDIGGVLPMPRMEDGEEDDWSSY